jgi:UDP-N-acetylglucosamine 2-epimerase (non-hydrolysing)
METSHGKNHMISVFYGTRPEYIKVKHLYDLMREHFLVELVRVNQHTTLTDNCYYDREVSVDNQNSNRLSNVIQSTLKDGIFPAECYLVIIQGDTATAFGIALNAFHHKIPVVHIEAGLRTYDIENPYPEESYRRCISSVAKYHFCATDSNSQNLSFEKVSGDVYIVGNTSLDNLIDVDSYYGNEVLVTLHRRENKELMSEWFRSLESAAQKNPHLQFIFPIHPSPDVIKHRHILKSVRVCDPMTHDDLIRLLSRCRFVVTDSGGIQEEASFLKKKTIVCRSHTERSEGIGIFSFMCDSPDLLCELIHTIDIDPVVNSPCPYGNGTAAQQIVNILKKELYNDKDIS